MRQQQPRETIPIATIAAIIVVVVFIGAVAVGGWMLQTWAGKRSGSGGAPGVTSGGVSGGAPADLPGGVISTVASEELSSNFVDLAAGTGELSGEVRGPRYRLKRPLGVRGALSYGVKPHGGKGFDAFVGEQRSMQLKRTSTTEMGEEGRIRGKDWDGYVITTREAAGSGQQVYVRTYFVKSPEDMVFVCKAELLDAGQDAISALNKSMTTFEWTEARAADMAAPKPRVRPAPPAPKEIAPAAPEPPITVALKKLEGANHSNHVYGLMELHGLKVEPERRQEVVKAVMPFMDNKERSIWASRILIEWSDDAGDKLMVEKLAATDAANLKYYYLYFHGRKPVASAAAAIVKRLPDEKERSIAWACLKKYGAVAEPAVRELLQSKDKLILQEAFSFMGTHGTAESLPEVERVAAANPSVRNWDRGVIERIKAREAAKKK
jgi:hypothetical protein